VVQAKAEGILAGTEVARKVFLRVDPSLEVTVLMDDGAALRPGDVIASVSGRVTSILQAERVMLNFLQRLSGIASLAAQYAARIQGFPVTILDTRKTTPGLRLLEKYAVRTGGGWNHRFSLSDGILIKDNHLAALRALGLGLGEIVARARRNAPPGLKVEVEVTSVEEAVEAAGVGADIIMLDNMTLDEMCQVVGLVPAGVSTEASGGVTLDNVRAVAETGVDFISVGALTHSARALDISLEMQPDSFELP
jgi:nicotinate-nucleotide pyrophosphorylase (carboxylating)